MSLSVANGQGAFTVAAGTLVAFSTMPYVTASRGAFPSGTPYTPSRSLLELCVGPLFSEKFPQFANETNRIPAVTAIGQAVDDLSACLCRIANKTSGVFSAIKSNVNGLFTIPEPPEDSVVYNTDEIPPLFQNISQYFFDVFIPMAERNKKPGEIGLGHSYGITLENDVSDTTIGLQLLHNFARDSMPASNELYAHVYCDITAPVNLKRETNADPDALNFVKELATYYFKDRKVVVFINGRKI